MLSVRYLIRSRKPLQTMVNCVNQNKRWYTSTVPSGTSFETPSGNPYLKNQQQPHTDVSPNTLHFEKNDLVYHQDLQINWRDEMQTIISDEENTSPLDLIEDTMSIDVEPSLRATFNFAAYVNKSLELQELLKLGVDLSKVETRRGALELFLKLKLNDNIKPMVTFLTEEIGVSLSKIGYIFTKNPYIFLQDLDNMRIRINYLLSKAFTPENVATIVERNPYWLSLTTERIDEKLGYFQMKFKLHGKEVRTLAIKKPTLITFSMKKVEDVNFSFQEEMGLEKSEIKELLLAEPSLFLIKRPTLLERYDYAFKKMKLSNEDILRTPQVLDTRLFRLQERHGFLKSLKRAQYNPKIDLYISPGELAVGTDAEFAVNVAKSTLETFDAYLRTL